MATLSPPSGVGITVSVVAMMPAAVKMDMPAPFKTGKRVASRMIAKLDALGMTRESRLPSRNTKGTIK